MRNKRFLAFLTAGMLTVSITAACSSPDLHDGSSVLSDSDIETMDNVSDDSNESAVSASSQTNVENSEDMFTKRDQDPSYDESKAVNIVCSGSDFKVTGTGAEATDGVLTISDEGVYVISGSINDGRIVVNAGDSAKVQIVLNGLSVKCLNNSPLFVKSANKVFITLKEQTVNTVVDGSSYTSLADDESNVDSAIFSRSDLTINGEGELNVEGNFSHAIVSKDDLVITGGTINAKSVTTAICGKDSVRISNGSVNVISGGDGIKSDNTDKADKGFVYISGGVIDITSETDAIQSEFYTTVGEAKLTLNTGGGSENSSSDNNGNKNEWGKWGGFAQEDQADDEDSFSAKGIKSGGDIFINGTTLTADTSDDAVHSNSNVEINSGTLDLKSGDDGIHADGSLTVNGGNITISKSYEGVEGASVTISGGSLDITSSDDGINAAGGSDFSSMNGRPGANSFDDNADVYVKVTGGNIIINSGGDGVDSNSELVIEGGTLYVDGPSDASNAAIDYETFATVSGATVVAVGNSGMAESFSEDSEQCSIMYNFSQNHLAGDKVTLTASDGKELISYTPSKIFNSVIISTKDILENGQYTLTVGDETVEIEMTSKVYSNGGSGKFGGNPRGFENEFKNKPDDVPDMQPRDIPNGGG